MPTPTNDEHRQAREASVFAMASTLVNERHPLLTDGQRKRLAQEITAEELKIDATSATPYLLSLHLDCIKDTQPALFRPVPDKDTVTQILLAQRDHSPTEQVSLARRVARMTPDELLAASEGADLTKLAAPREHVLTPYEASRVSGLTPEDEKLLARGHNVHELSPDRRMEMRMMVAQETATKDTPAILEARTLMEARNVPFSGLDARLQIRAGREAKEAGKGLHEYGINTSE